MQRLDHTEIEKILRDNDISPLKQATGGLYEDFKFKTDFNFGSLADESDQDERLSPEII